MDIDMQTESSVASTSSAPLVHLPYITIQHDIQEVIRDVADGTVAAESIWVSVYKEGCKSVHGKVLIRSSQGNGTEDVEFEAQGGITFERTSSFSFSVGCSELEVSPTLVKMPRQIQSSLLGKSKGIDCMDISPNDQLYVVGGQDGVLKVGNVRTNEIEQMKPLTGHLGDILSCRFFPSSEVVLSSSSDLTARIFSALDGSNPRTLKGHTAAVTDTAIIGRGKHVLTTSNDGTLKLWHVGSAKCLKTWRPGQTSRKRVLAVVILNAGSSKTATVEQSAEDNDSHGTTAAVALEDGSVALIDLATSGSDLPLQMYGASSTSKAVISLAQRQVLNRTLLAAGTSNGEISVVEVDTSDSTKPVKHLLQVKRNSADVTSLAFFDTDASDTIEERISLLASSIDGLMYRLNFGVTANSPMPYIEAEYAGYDIDACNAVRSVAGQIYTAGRDGMLRRY